jgi:hypothetical protein
MALKLTGSVAGMRVTLRNRKKPAVFLSIAHFIRNKPLPDLLRRRFFSSR